jgi:hypothetical protein
VPDRYERNGPKNGIIPFLPANDPKSGTIKRSQKRDAEPISFEPTIEPDSMLLSLSDQSQINEWAPSPKVLKTLKYLAVREDFAEEVLELFRDYWEEEGELHTDRQWDWMYLERCLEQRERRAKRVSGGRAAT